jgi:hypothetical protein
MVTTDELNEAFRREAERRGMPFKLITAREILRGYAGIAVFGTDPTVPARPKPPAGEFKDAGANI